MKTLWILIQLAYLRRRLEQERRKNVMLREMWRTLTGEEWPEGRTANAASEALGLPSPPVAGSADFHETRLAVSSATKHRGRWDETPRRPYPQNNVLSVGCKEE